jgi:hypothetical protein
MNKPKVLVLEFNELCPSLLEKWMSEGHLPNFKALHDASQVFVTESDVDDLVYLEPWIQWYSMHTGLSYDQHKVFHLTDGPKADNEDVWKVLRDGGFKVASFASMNNSSFQGDGCFYVADPWCDTQPSYPDSLNVYQKIVSKQVQEYSNPEEALTIGEYLKFGWFMLTHGLSFKTIRGAVSQLFNERVSSQYVGWKRVALLDQIQFDVFRHYYRTYRPDFASFFLNSTAHLQHTYWRFMAPEDFSIQPAETDMQAYGNAVLFGYQKMDRLLSEFDRLVDEDTLVILASALSQQPFNKADESGGQHFYRPRKVADMLAELGIVGFSAEPVMTHQYMINADSDAEAEDIANRLRRLQYNGRCVFDVRQKEAGAVFFGCQISISVPEDAEIDDIGDGSTRGFFDILYAIDNIKSGSHHHDGVLWIRNGQHEVHAERASILDVFPTIIDIMGIPDSLPANCNGKSLKTLL